MTIWICTLCGNAGRRPTFSFDGCYLCGGDMETKDGRTTAELDEDDYDRHLRRHRAFMCRHPEYAEEFDLMEEVLDRQEAENGDTAAIIRLWQSGRPLPASQQARLDDIRLANSIDALTAIYGGAAA